MQLTIIRLFYSVIRFFFYLHSRSDFLFGGIFSCYAVFILPFDILYFYI